MDRALIDRTIAIRGGFLQFPAVLEQRFEADTRAGRCRELVLRGFIALMAFDSFLIIDYLAIPEEFGLALLTRLGVTIFGLLVLALISRDPPPVLREGAISTVVLAAAVAIVVIMMAHSNLLAKDYLYGMLLVPLLGMIAQRLRFRCAVAVSVGCVVLHGFAMWNIEALTLPSQLMAGLQMCAASVFALVAGYTIERDERIDYLQALRQRLRTEELESLSTHDALTGLGNRRGLERTLSWISADAAGNGKLAVIIADIDKFKAFNDHFGHPAGDKCIKQVAAIMAAEVRIAGDAVFRYGGEEFIVLLPGIEADGAAAIAERMRYALEAAGIPHVEPVEGAPLTASFGVATARLGESFRAEDLVERADAALYRAKNGGRNCVVVDGVHAAAESGSAV
ncbi:GGDEF domain-containing protein [Ciceribacter naphthalenivorans]|uniref:diguanylate cyclase n=2 Tax=Alphaproteobacteria TaxID=28211 RepID=A0A512HIY7_9HYPH|nr:GGDEF domain-containing protein [Ciceribacter naphthalenivorans]GEO85418.1 GGDEF domain-containing protein [Ciceribacter naphthalenivorans]GLR21560.1 GGDEF domain-containing protein [Ciceribacter naphthalenivorans]GLT04416.1 GGDEF domain-containing protein [Sphingomonas psychrolutea]